MTREIRRETFWAKAAERAEKDAKPALALLYRNEAFEGQAERDEYDDVLRQAKRQHYAAKKEEEL